MTIGEVSFVDEGPDHGTVREVVGACLNCWPSQPPAPELADIYIVSPSGVAHQSHENGCDVTACGADATKEGWWHRL